MEALVHDDIHDFVATAGAFLEADPVNHSVHLTAVDAALRGDREARTLITLHEDGAIVGAVTRMDGRPLHVAAMPPAAAPLVAKTLREGPDIDEITGPLERVEAFRTVWRDGGRELYRLRLYRLEDLVVPDVTGEAKLATPADDDLITEWWIAFVTELDGLTREGEKAEERVRDSRWMSAGHVLWLVDGVPVS